MAAGFSRYDAVVATDTPEIAVKGETTQFTVKMMSDLASVRVTRISNAGTRIETFWRVP